MVIILVQLQEHSRRVANQSYYTAIAADCETLIEDSSYNWTEHTRRGSNQSYYTCVAADCETFIERSTSKCCNIAEQYIAFNFTVWQHSAGGSASHLWILGILAAKKKYTQAVKQKRPKESTVNCFYTDHWCPFSSIIRSTASSSPHGHSHFFFPFYLSCKAKIPKKEPSEFILNTPLVSFCFDPL